MKTILKMKHLVMLFVLALFTFNGCSKDDVLTPEPDSVIKEAALKSNGKIIHRAVLGTNDACEALGQSNGCDGNFSLVANMYANGTVTGQWQDTFFGGGEGLHVSIDCMQYGVTQSGVKYAVVSGIITNGSINGVDVSGQTAITAIADNVDGQGLDLMSFSYSGLPFDCHALPINAYTLLPVGTGQAIVW